ncbi:O-antigen ligase [Clostridium cavendishii DSM 21758]|uniref:O-antigen ligase n=1 Tax=Clostridium cavendishii DSM 21758 TaxID=1121302 RepID=A0A1M6QDL4_9CLOT|nr:O-antigen ligase family protein [Clostridium cavendishii]SHK18286.1 O-antigen ligase [Clostridium cavendishii DSM 21758]
MLNNQLNDNHINKKSIPISITTCFLCLTILFVFKCNDQFFNLGKYYILPIATIIVGCFQMIFMLVKGKIKLRIEHYCIIFILLYITFITYILQLPSKFDTVMSYYMLFLLLFVMSIVEFKPKEIKIINISYIFSGLIFAIILLKQMQAPYPGVTRYSVFYSEINFYDSNFLAAYMFLPSLLAFNKGIISKKKTKQLLYYIIAAIISLAILLTGSRAGVVALFLGIIMLLCKDNKKFIIKIIIIGIIIFIIYELIPEELIQRFFMESYNDGSNQKRLLDWNYGWETFKTSPFWGTGMIWTIDAISSRIMVDYTVHNTIIGFMMQFGIIGFIPIIILFVNLFKEFLNKSLSIMLISLIGLMFLIIMIEAQSSIVLFFPFIFMYIILNFKKNNNNVLLTEIL